MPVVRSRCGSSVLRCLLGPPIGVTPVVVADLGEHVPVVLRCCSGQPVLCDCDLCRYLVLRQCVHTGSLCLFGHSRADVGPHGCASSYEGSATQGGPPFAASTRLPR